MEFRDFITKKSDDILRFTGNVNESDPDVNTKAGHSGDAGASNLTDEEYFNMLNPETGLRYDIPMVSPVDPTYYFKYIYYMKLKERSPETFQKILNWE
jgi:hypothetical protein